MSRFVPSIDHVDPEWFKRWGATFGSPELALEMFQNERLRDRTYEQMLAHSDVEADIEFSDVELACLHSFINVRERLERVCGLVMFGRHIRDSVSRTQFEKMSKLFSVDDLKLVIELRDFHPEADAFSVDLSRLQEMVSRAGEACLAIWREHQSEQLQLRLALIDNSPALNDPAHLPLETEKIISLVETVGTRLASQ